MLLYFFAAVSLIDTAFAKQMHGFASPPKPSGSLLTSGKARDIARRATSRTDSSAHEPPNEVRSDVLRFCEANDGFSRQAKLCVSRQRNSDSRTVCIANAWVRILRVKPSRARSGSLRAKIFAAGEIPVRSIK